MSIFNVFSLMGGLALFLYGMDVMGKSLEKQAGSKLSGILAKLTSNTFKGFLLGLGVTSIVQSSSATTVMVVGFVNSGIMTLKQAIGIIMGANVGTTVTAWILSLSGIDGTSFFVQLLKPSSFAPLLAFIGIILYMSSKKDKNKNIGAILLGFCILMTGMETMSSAVKPLANMSWFSDLFISFSNPVIGVLVGAGVTAVIQSSSASVGILQALSSTGVITVGSALPIILGQNIGTCVTAILSSFGTNKNAKRTAAVHLYFNIIGATIFLIGFYGLNALIHFSFIENTIGHSGIAIIHTLFNVTTTIIMLPLAGFLEKMAMATIKDDGEDEEFQLLDQRFLQTPTVAVERSTVLVNDMAKISFDGFIKSINSLSTTDEIDAEEITRMEKSVDKYEDKLGSYLVQLSQQDMTTEDSHQISKILHVINDLERISDYSINILDAFNEIKNKKISFSKEAQKEIKILESATLVMLEHTYNAFIKDDSNLAQCVQPLQQVIEELVSDIKNNHINRLRNKVCTIELGFVLSDILNAYERVSAHCTNIAIAVIESHNNDFAPHASARNYRNNETALYNEIYQKYKKSYKII